MPDFKNAVRERLEFAGLDPVTETDVVEELANHLDDRYSKCRRMACRTKNAAAGRSPNWPIETSS